MNDNIKQHMEVIASDGTTIGTVDRVQGSEIKLTKGGGTAHHFIPLDWVERVDSHVHLSKAANEVKSQWREAA